MITKKKICVSCGEETYIYARKMCITCDRKENPHKHGFAKDNVEKKSTKNPSYKRPESKYKKIYFDFFGISQNEPVSCEVCESPAVDIHHIDARGMGGDPTKSKDKIENLMALCRSCHHEADFGTKFSKNYLKSVHLSYIEKMA